MYRAVMVHYIVDSFTPIFITLFQKAHSRDEPDPGLSVLCNEYPDPELP
jgi:hypothetical protein